MYFEFCFAGLSIAALFCAAVAQLVERNLAKVEVESSRLFCRSKMKKGKRHAPSLFCILRPL
jgi:hypothetical protein